MNRLHRLVWSPRLHMLVAVAETAHACGKSAAGESAPAPARRSGGTEGARAWPRALAAIAAASLLAIGAPAWAAALPAGSLLDINNGSNGNNGNSYSSGWAHYTIDFNPTASGNNYVLFAFRQDPAYWTFGNVSLTVAGDSTNLFTDPNFASGGTLSAQSGLQAPAHWGIVYQTGTTPYAAGSWQPGFNGDSTAGSWYDGAVGSFDGIYQGVGLTAGTHYTIGFSLSGDNAASAARGVEMGVFAGTCVSLTGPAESCVPDNAAFTALATPDQTANAGHPATDIDTAAASYAASDVSGTVNPVFDGGTLRMDASPTQDFTITGNGGTIDQAGAASSFSGVLSDAGAGGGSLTITNSGSGGAVTMTGANTYTGATTIDAGATLALAGAGSIAASSGLQADGTFDIGGTDAGASLQTLSGNGNVVLGAQTLTLTAAHDTFGGTLSGTGGLTVAGGTETLSGASTYTGGTTVTNGATVRVGADANLGAASGGVRLDGGTLQTTASFDSARDLTLGAAGGTIDIAGGTTLADSGAVGGTGTLGKAGDGTLALTGTLSHTGGTRVDAGTLVLGGTNSYAGGTTVNTGATLQVSADANLGATDNNALTLAGGTLRTTGTFASGRDIAVGAGGGTISTDAGTTLAIGGSVGGTGTLRKSGDGELVLGGVIAGSGGVTVEAGKETLTAANTYTGATSIGAGATLALAGEGAIAASSGVQADGTFDIAAGNAGASVQTLAGSGRVLLGTHDLTLTGAHDTFAGTISGSGGVSVAGGTETLSGTNSYSGGTSVRDGATLRIADDANLGDASGGVTLDGGTLRATGDLQTARDFTLGAAGGVIGADNSVQASGNVSGTGALTTTGPGVVVLTGSASQAGGVHVTGGALALFGANSYSGGTTVDNGALLAVAADDNLGATTGNALTLDGGTLLNIASFDTARDIALTANGGTMQSVSDTVLTVRGAVTGAGPLTQSGDGTLVLAGSNSYAGGTRITGGTLQVGADANLGDASGSVSLDGGTLQATASFASARDLVLGASGGTLRTDAGVTLADSGAVTGSGTLTKDGAGTLRLDGALAHTGGTAVNGGTLALSGTNSYSGGTTVRNGATLQVAADANLGATAGNALTLDGGTLETTASFDTARDLALGPNGGTLRTDAGTTLTNATGSITGDGVLVKNGAGTLALGGTLAQSGGVTVQDGTLALAGTNTYTGGTTVGNGATLQVTADANLGATAGNALALNGGTLQAGASFATARDIALGAQGGTVDTTAGSTLDASGVISGAAGLAKTGAGTLVLAGANTYTGATTVAAGTLALAANGSLAASSGVQVEGSLDLTGSGADVALQSVAGSGAVHLGNHGLTLTNAHDAFAGAIDGAGGLSVAGGTQALTGSNSYTGGTTVRGGAVLQVGADANLGAATGTLTLDGGTLQATRSFGSDRDVSIAAAGGSVRTDSGTDLTLNGSLSGSGTLVKQGSGTLTLAGDNAGPDHTPGTGWTGGITIGGGLVQVTNAWGLGWGDVQLAGGTINTLVDIRTGQKIAVAPGASIDTAAGTVTTLSGTMSSVGGGNGCFVKSGAGTLNMTGSATLGNGTCVQQGDLRANGTLTSNVSVDAGATLGGAGLIRGSVDVHGTLSPGNSPGYLTVAGDVNMAAGSTFQEDIAGTTQASAATPVGATGYYSYLDVTNNGRFVIDPASTLAPRMKNIFTPAEAGFNAPAYVPALGDSFRIVTADGGIAGRFGTLTQPDGLASGTRFAAFYDVFGSNSIDLVVLPTSYANTLAGSNGNTRSVAGALDAIAAQDQVGTASATQDQLLYMVARQNAAALPAYAQSLAGEVHAAVAAASSQAGLGLSGAVGQQLRRAADTSADVQTHSALWLAAQGRHARWSGDADGSGFTTNGSQFTLGADVYRRGTTRLGVGFSHASTRIGADQGSADLDENFAFAYGQRAAGRFVLDGLAAYGRSHADTQRADPTGLSATALASASKGRSALLAVGVRAPWKVDGATVAPFGRITVQNVTRDATTEGAGSPAALGLARFSATGTRLVAGLSGTSAQADPLQAAATWNYSAGLGFDAGALSRPSVQADLAGLATQISAPHAGRVFLQVDASGTMRVRPNAYVYYGVTGEARSGAVGVGVNAGLRVAF